MVDKLRTLVCLFVLACCISAWPSSGQKYNGSSPPAAAFTGPGDVVAGATAWYGLRAYTAAIAAAATPPMVNLIRASDSHTCDVLPATNGGLGITANCSTGGDNSTAVATWCNATTCSTPKWYDQTLSGNCTGTCDLVQATVAKQPILQLSGCSSGSLPCLLCTSAGSMIMSAAAAVNQSQPLSLTDVAFTTGTSMKTMSDQNTIQTGLGSNAASMYAGTVVTATAANNHWWSVVNVFNGASSSITVDGSTTGSLNPGASSIGIPRVCEDAFANFSDGKIAETGIWATSFNAGQITNMNSNMQTYWGT